MTVILHSFSSASIDEVRTGDLTNRDTVYRKLLELAVGRAIFAGRFGSIPQHLVGGIVGSTERGDRYPELFLEKKRLRPSDFGSSVLNSGIGHCSIVFGLRGPQVQLVGEVDIPVLTQAGYSQIRAGRADFMVIVRHKRDNTVEAGLLSE